MVDITLKPASFTDADKPKPVNFGDVKPFIEKYLEKADLTAGAALSYNCVTISDYINILFSILKENVAVDTKIKQDLFQAQTILKTIYKDNINIEKFLTMLIGSIIKVCNEYKQNNNAPTQKQ